jgi:signal transduction histidine kinase
VAGSLLGLLAHVQRANLALARFVDSVRLGDASARMPGGGGSSFATLAGALNEAVRDLQRERTRDIGELRFLEALLDDVPIALLLVEGRQVRLGNKAARGLFGRESEGDRARFAAFGAPLVAILAGEAADGVVPLTLPGGTQRALVRHATIVRLGATTGAVMVEPIQQALDAAEVSAQGAMVRVLTHEILNSLTPIVSLAGTAAVLLGEDPIELDEARVAVLTLARRAEATRRFIDSYREMAKPLEPRRRPFAAAEMAQEMARLFAVDWLDHRLETRVDEGLTLDADPDLLAQALLNLLRNAAQASDREGRRHVALRMLRQGEEAVIEVEDDGPGIPEPVARDIFLPFFTTKEGGTGIGLHLVRQVVVAHGGQVEAGAGTMGGALFRLRRF